MSRPKSEPPRLPIVSLSMEDSEGKTMHFYQFHIGDYKSHTHHLSLIEDLAFRRLLDHYYLHEAPIKQRDVARQIGMRDHEQEVLAVLNEFFVSTENGFINPRADEEITKYRKFSEDGKKGAAVRWHKGGNGEANSPPNATPMATNNQEPITNNHKPIKDKEAIASLSGSTFPPCPHQELLKLWAKHLPHLTQPRSWEGQRQTSMRQRWVQAGKPSSYSPDGYNTVDKGIEWWDSFFRYIAHETKLSTGFVMNDRTWLPDLEWVVNAANFQKIIDGKYNK
jgi:uncharacterized protein YdaU (DUF1376 family)